MRLQAIGICVVLGVGLTGCAEIKPTTSYYGHGVYHCYFHSRRTGQYFEARADTEKEASRLARHECRLYERDHLDSVHCHFTDCVFK